MWATRYFLRLIPPLFNQAIGANRCVWHDALIGALDATDTVVSFNYDCLVDQSLRDIAKRRWNPASGYGVPAGGGTAHWTDHSGTGRFPKAGGLRLLKLHGSLDWQVAAKGLSLIETPYERRPHAEICIVPPLWQKSFDEAPFHDVWLAARSALTTTKALMLIGYSLPLTDVYTQALLRIDVQALDFLLIVNPDANAATRITQVLRSALRPSTRVVQFPSLASLGKVL